MRPIKIAVISFRTILIAVVIVVLGVTAYAVTSSSATRITIYNPQGFKATETGSGNCFTGSIAAQRAGAFRCMVDNSIFDPCFNTDGSVACPVGDPARNSGMLIKLTEPLPQPPEAWENPPDPANPRPWYFTLAGGGNCGALTGTLPDPDFRFGCVIPKISDSAYCTMPVQLTQKPSTWIATCGVFDQTSREIVQKKAYRVARMWL